MSIVTTRFHCQFERFSSKSQNEVQIQDAWSKWNAQLENREAAEFVKQIMFCIYLWGNPFFPQLSAGEA